MLVTRALAIAVATVSLGVVVLLWERRRRRRRQSTDDTAMSSACATSGSLDGAVEDAQTKFKELASKSSATLTEVTVSQQSVAVVRTNGEIVINNDEEDLVQPTSAEQLFTSAETAETSEEQLVTDSVVEEHSYCLPPARSAEGSVESVASDSVSFSSYEVLSSPDERVIAEGSLNVVAYEEVVDSSAINASQEDSPTLVCVDRSKDAAEPSPAEELMADSVSVETGTSDSMPAESMTGGLLAGWVRIEQQQEQFTNACLQCGDNLSQHCFATLVDAVKGDAGESMVLGDTGLNDDTDKQSSGTLDVNSCSVQEASISVDSTTMQDYPSLSHQSLCPASIDSTAVELGRPDGFLVPMVRESVTNDVTECDEGACVLDVQTDGPLVNGAGMQKDPVYLCEEDNLCSIDTLAAPAFPEVPAADQISNCSEPGVSSAVAYVDHGLRQFTASGDAAEVTSTLISAEAAAAYTAPLDVERSQREHVSSELASWSEASMLLESHATSVPSPGEYSSLSSDSGSLTIADEKCVPTDINEQHSTLSSNSSIQAHYADTFASDAANDEQVVEHVHGSSSISFVSTSAVSASSDALSLVADASEHLNGVKTVVTSSVQDSVGGQSNSELRSGDSRQNGNERVFKFYLPTAMCGLFIGKKGRNVNQLKAKSGAYIHVEALPTARDRHLCVVKGTDTAVSKAVRVIIDRFPQLEPELNAELYPLAVNASPSAVDVSLLQLQLVPQTPVSVLLANVAASTRVFVQLPTHPTFTSLERLSADILEVYSGAAAGDLPPLLEEPVMPGSLCAVESEGAWYRALIIQQLEPYAGEGSCMQLRYLDYGGYDRVPLTRIRQLRPDFLTLPFQAVECSLAHVKPLPGADSLSESNAVTTLASFTGYLLECINIGADGDTGLPSVELYANNNGVAVYINQLVSGTGDMEWLSTENPIH